MEERRKYPRMIFNTEIVYSKIDSVDASSKFHSKNISAGGICLIVDKTISKGDRLHLKIKLPSQEIIETKGMVVWVEDFSIIGGLKENAYEAGIEFYDITEQQREKLSKFVFFNKGR